MIPTIVGGIGLFLLGMILMTDGLKAAAGDALRQVLRRFTGDFFRIGVALQVLVLAATLLVVPLLFPF